ncbi:MAG TPA: phosphoserine phosphatase SerB [Devosia sp.]|nr:phosphoserine phosphatase SerB [Devosia sp.]
MSVLCLTANPSAPELDTSLVAAIQHETQGEINWLNHGVACEIIEPKAADPVAVARALIGKRAVDANLVPLANRRKRLLVADMDSTMIDQECIDELADAVGIKDQVADITARAMRGELNFEDALRTRVSLIKGLERKVIEEIRRERITLAQGSRTLVQTMKTHGAVTSLVSGGFTIFADWIGKRLGFDEAVANVLEFDGDRLTGTVAEPIVGREMKVERLLALAAEHDIPIAATIAVGDGANDLGMIQASGLGVALHAKPIVAEQAAARLDHSDLTALLYLQGYPEDDFVR